MADNISIRFLGAAGTVTGSKYQVEHGGRRVLVDCGLFQGLKKLRLLNRAPLPVDVPGIEAVLLTHGHLDHCGYLPRLVKTGFRGRVYGTEPTLEISEIILKDSARIQEEESEKANREGYSRHRPAKPLYDSGDVERTLPHFSAVPANEWMTPCEGMRARFVPNGHIIGSAFIELEVAGRRLVFSGDIGRTDDVLMHPPLKPERADAVVMESTYGNLIHHAAPPREKLARIVNDTVRRGGTLIIPSFAVERAQALMLLLWQLHREEAVPSVPFILDSPMSSRVLAVFHKYAPWHRLPPEECTEMCRRFRLVSDFSETLQVIASRKPKVVIAGSGMVTGGRVLHYLKEYIGRPETTVMLVGYQAAGTRGRDLLDGAHDVKFYGSYHPVKARIELLEGLSAHADQAELLDWLSGLDNAPGKIFITHGEAQAADALRRKITDTYGWECEIPELWHEAEIPAGVGGIASERLRV